MKTVSDIKVIRAASSRLGEVDFGNIVFGKVYSDHMFAVDYIEGEWQEPSIVPYGAIELSPATTALHYAQSIFEGMKAYRTANGEPVLFRPRANFERMNRSAERMVMPAIPEELFLGGVKELVHLDADWIPSDEDSALYIRPVMFANDDFIGVKPSDNYKFLIFTCPVGKYYTDPVRLWVTREFVRAASGGTGAAKTAGNYAASYYATKIAQDKGYDNVLWLDGKEHRMLEECGTMNMFFVIDGVVVTPALTGTILQGVTRDSVITLLREMDIKVEERSISMEELKEAHADGKLEEAFGAGTAAAVSPVIEIADGTDVLQLPPNEERKIGPPVLQHLTAIRRGIAEDKYGWLEKI